jgi:peptide/nickel transport system substrate-binding protein
VPLYTPADVKAFVLAALLLVTLPTGALAEPRPASKPEGEMRWALYVTLAPAWFDPGEVSGGFLTPFWVLYAMHDALVKPLPGNLMAPSLAESWTVSTDGRVYDFKLREGLKFHNGDAFTADDVKFSFQRSKAGKVLKDRVRDIEIVSPTRVRFHLQEPFPDFMAFYGTLATGAGWIVPKKYVEKVGDEGFKKQPVGLGPYRFVSYTPGVELVMDAFEGYWRKVPAVKRLVFKTVPDPTARAAMLRAGEVDVSYMLDAPAALELKRDPNFRLGFSGAIGVHYLDFFDQWDPKSPWADRRVRLAANHAIDRRALSEAETLGASRPTGAMAPRTFEFTLPLEPYAYDPAKAKKLLAEAGYPNGFDGGDFYPYPPYWSAGESIIGYFGAVGIRMKLRTMERAAFQPAWAGKKLHGVCMCTLGNFGNAATRLAEVVVSDGVYARGADPDVEALFKQQARETDRKKREVQLHQIQQLVYERVRFGPLYEFIWPSGIGPRVAEPGLMLIDPYPWSAPLEDVRLKR